MYPLLSEYIESILSSDDNLDHLRGLEPVIDSSGRPVMSSGNYAVVFKMKDKDGQYYALKCFLRDQEERGNRYKCITERLSDVYSPYFVKVNYYEHELFVDSSNSEENEFPVLVMDWVEGLTLNEYIRQNLDSEVKLKHLAFSFGEMASWLLKQDFAHGDIKPDNIIVQKDGSIILVDYDGMFVPELKYKKATELGSPNYRHPLRNDSNFDSSIDDFSLIVILLSLRIIAISPELWNSTSNSDGLLFCENDFKDIWGCDVIRSSNLLEDEEANRLLGLLMVAISNKTLNGIDGKLLQLKNRTLGKIFWDYSRNSRFKFNRNRFKSGNGLIYSDDRKCLLSGQGVTLPSVEVLPGTEFIADDAFKGNKLVKRIVLPEGLLGIGRGVFYGCTALEEIYIPDTLLYPGDAWIFAGCDSLKVVHSKYYHSDNHCLIIHGNLVKVLCDYPLDEFRIPHSVMSIFPEAFASCKRIYELYYPDSFKVSQDCLGNSSINRIIHKYSSDDKHCVVEDHELKAFVADEPIDYRIPNTIERIGFGAFSRSKNLKSVIIPTSVKHLDNDCFSNCINLIEVFFENTSMTSYMLCFRGCISLTTVTLPKSLKKISAGFFRRCSSLREIILPDSLEIIDNCAFSHCSSLQKIVIPDSVTNINKEAFAFCNSLTEVEIGKGIIEIQYSAFKECTELKSIKFSSSAITISPIAFMGCSALETILIPRGTSDEFSKQEAFAELDVSFVEY